jgi:S-adenosylmethionine hydrolase
MIITLTTDFGYTDPFVGVMKGVIFGINPQVQVVDLTHGIPAQDVMAAALVLRHSTPYFPGGTIHVAVVDPGVGSTRRPLLIEFDGNYFIGPDNGVLSLVRDGEKPSRIVHLANPRYQLQPTSSTFHGRDIFAPTAAHLSLLRTPELFGENTDAFVRLSWPRVVKTDLGLVGEIVYIDGFGNLFTNIGPADLEGQAGQRVRIELRDLSIAGLAASYAAVEPNQYVALINSWGLLEIALRDGSAQRRSRALIGDQVHVMWLE